MSMSERINQQPPESETLQVSRGVAARTLAAGLQYARNLLPVRKEPTHEISSQAEAAEKIKYIQDRAPSTLAQQVNDLSILQGRLQNLSPEQMAKQNQISIERTTQPKDKNRATAYVLSKRIVIAQNNPYIEYPADTLLLPELGKSPTQPDMKLRAVIIDRTTSYDGVSEEDGIRVTYVSAHPDMPDIEYMDTVHALHQQMPNQERSDESSGVGWSYRGAVGTAWRDIDPDKNSEPGSRDRLVGISPMQLKEMLDLSQYVEALQAQVPQQ